MKGIILGMKRHTQSGFTIVELLIVIVVIGILAAITIVAFNGVQDSARTASIQADISQAMKQLETTRFEDASEQYPASAVAAGLQASDGNTLEYHVNSLANSYCVTVSNDDIVYSATSIDKTVKTGDCTTNNLAAWWPLNGNANDTSGNGLNGTYTIPVAGVGQNGQANNALSFTGSGSGVVVPHDDALAPSSMTVSFWINPAAWTAATATSFLEKREAGSGYFIFYLNGSNTINIDCSSAANRWNTGITPPLNAWSHVTVTCDERGLSSYLNGAAVGSRGPINNDAVNVNTALNLGAEGGGYVYNGRMDDVRIYNRLLAPTEVQELFSGGAQ